MSSFLSIDGSDTHLQLRDVGMLSLPGWVKYCSNARKRVPRCDGVFNSSPIPSIWVSNCLYHAVSRSAGSIAEFKWESKVTAVGQLKLVPTERAGVKLTTRWMASGAMMSRSPGWRMCAAPPVNGSNASSGRWSGPVSNDVPRRSRFSLVGGHTRTSFVPCCA